MTEIMPVPRNLNFTVLSAGSVRALFILEQKGDSVRQQRDDAARDDNAEEDDRHGSL